MQKEETLTKTVVVKDEEEGERGCSLLERAQLTADGDSGSAGWCQHTHTHTHTADKPNTHTHMQLSTQPEDSALSIC